MNAVDIQVQTPQQAKLAAKAAATAATEGEAQVIQFPTNNEPSAPSAPTEQSEQSGERPVMRVLLDAYENGDIVPVPVALGPMPRRATQAMIRIAADMRLRFGLELEEGFQRPLMYAASEAVRARCVHTPKGARDSLKKLCAAVVIKHVGEMTPRGQPRGTFLYVPPSWWPTCPEARAIVEATGKHPDAAHLVWVPDEQDGGAA